MATTLKFSLDTIEEVQEAEESLYERAKKSRFAKVKIKLFGTGENAHTEPVEFEALQKSADSAYDIPLIAELNPYRAEKDFGSHGTLTGKQFSFGFIKEAKDNPKCLGAVFLQRAQSIENLKKHLEVFSVRYEGQGDSKIHPCGNMYMFLKNTILNT